MKLWEGLINYFKVIKTGVNKVYISKLGHHFTFLLVLAADFHPNSSVNFY